MTVKTIQQTCDDARKIFKNYPWFISIEVQKINGEESILLMVLLKRVGMPKGWADNLCYPFPVTTRNITFEEYITCGKDEQILIKKTDSGPNNFLFVGSYAWEWHVMLNNYRKTYQPMSLFYSPDIVFFPYPKALKSGKYIWWPHLKVPVVNTNSVTYKKLTYSFNP